MSNAGARETVSDRAMLLGLACLAAAVAVGWAGASLSSLLSGHGVPRGQLLTPLAAFLDPLHPARAWHQNVGPVPLYWSTTAAAAVAAAGPLGYWFLRVRSPGGFSSRGDLSRLEGTARRRDADRAAGGSALRDKGSTLRPSLDSPALTDLGQRLGQSSGVVCWSSVEDSVVVLGPPRAGKGLHLVIPMILDAPGPVVTTSTRPDNLTATLRARMRLGPVAVFDPQNLAPGIPSLTRWSPIRGCEDAQTALVRAKALTAGAANGTTDANFWQASAEQAVRCLLHAGALGDRGAADLYRWSLSAAQAREAVMILGTHPAAAAAWHQALDSIVSAEQRQRDSVWAMVGITFACLADPNVLRAVSPAPGEQFDPSAFLGGRGTVYLLGTSTGAAATSRLVSAFVEDVVEAARRVAARSAGARLDPPLSVVLDEAANYPLPSLPSLMSEGGGTGITPIVVLQSQAQARAVFGEHQAGAIWDSAIVKVILGGGSNARDLEDLSKVIGTRRDQQDSHSYGPDGRRSTSTTPREVPILGPARLRTLPFGTAMLLLRSAPPIVLTLSPWTARTDATALAADRTGLEEAIQRAHTQAG